MGTTSHEDLLSGRIFGDQRRHDRRRSGRRRCSVRARCSTRWRASTPERASRSKKPPAAASPRPNFACIWMAHRRNTAIFRTFSTDRRRAAGGARQTQRLRGVRAAGRGRGAGARRAHRESSLPRSGRGRFDRRYRGRLRRARSAGQWRKFTFRRSTSAAAP